MSGINTLLNGIRVQLNWLKNRIGETKKAVENLSEETSAEIEAVKKAASEISTMSKGGYVFSVETEIPGYSDNDTIYGVYYPFATKVVDGQFNSASNLRIALLPSITSIGAWAFYNCSSLTSVTFAENSQLTSIGSYAFYNCSSLTSITIPDGVTSIGNSAFSGCSGLTSITIPDSVTSIGNSAFRGCSSLTSITIPDGVTSIGNSAFSGCSGLTSITIPDSVTSIGYDAFYGCSSLTSITFAGTVEQWNAITLGTNWKSGVPATKVVCSDGTVAL